MITSKMHLVNLLLVNLFLACLTIGLVAANELKMTQDNWVLDKTNDSSVEINGSKLKVQCTPSPRNRDTRYPESSWCEQFNALYLGIVANETNKRFYWEFTCVRSCKSVGIAKKNHYLSDGRTIKGAFFHINLHNNGELLVSGFGEGIKDGDRIGFILDAGEQDLKIYLVQNDRPLGLAYIQKAPYANELYPAVTFKEPGSVEINEKKNVSTDHLLVRVEHPEKGAQGDYKLVKVTVNGTVKDVPEGRYTLRLGKPNGDDGKIPMSLAIANRLRGRIVKVGNDVEGDLYTLENITSTLIGPTGKTLEDETLLFTLIQELKRMKFNEQFDELIITCDPGTIMLFKRFQREFKPYETSDLLA